MSDQTAAPNGDLGVIATCSCHDTAARIELDGSEHVGSFDGSISARLMPLTSDAEGRPLIPLEIVGYSTTSTVRGLGSTTLDVDFDADVEGSEVRARGSEELFPAVQTMRLRITVTSDALGGELLRSRNVGTLVNEAVDAFPPSPGATYTLREPVELEDAAGTVRGRMVEVNTSIVSTEIEPSELIVGRGIVLYPLEGSSYTVSRDVPTVALRFRTAEAGRVAIRLVDADGRTTSTAFDSHLESGEHTVDVDLSRLPAGAGFYELLVDGERRSARMPVRASA
jgi:hypothetical protein